MGESIKLKNKILIVVLCATILFFAFKGIKQTFISFKSELINEELKDRGLENLIQKKEFDLKIDSVSNSIESLNLELTDYQKLKTYEKRGIRTNSNVNISEYDSLLAKWQ
jgi:hypothetical protein